MTVYPLSSLRTLALHTQGLTTPNGRGDSPSLNELIQTVERLGCVQIDTLQMVKRSQYLVLWSRLGCYDPLDFDRLLCDPLHRYIFEGWQHAACLISLKDYRYQIPYQRLLKQQPSSRSVEWLAEPGTAELIQSVQERIRYGGAARTSDFEYHGPRRGSWWDWKPAKNALEHLYAWGDLMIAGRVNFQRVYDLTERVLPEWVDTRAPTIEERDRYWVESGLRTLGVCTPAQAGDYTYRKRTIAYPIVESLLAEGILHTIQSQLINGKTQDFLIHRDNLTLLEQVTDGAIAAQRTSFLSPFDNLFWAHRRDEHLWGFHQSLEAYLPAGKRVWGYFCLPILHHDRLVGRFDPKLERATSTLRIKALYLEPDIAPDEELVFDVALTMRDFLAFHQTTSLIIERSQPIMFGEKILSMIPDPS